MAHAYTPGLTVSRKTTHSCRRILPIKGDVLVEMGQEVASQDIVAQTFMPGDIEPVNLSNLLSMPPGDVGECVLKKVGDRIEVGEVLAETKGIFGFFKNVYKSKFSGTVETISQVTGQVILRGEPVPVQVEAYLAGKVKDVIPEEGVVIEAEATFVQGIFGIGGAVYGPIRMAVEEHVTPLTPELITDDMKGCVVVGGGRMSFEAIHRAREVGVHAVVSGGIDDHDLKKFLGYDLGVAITGSEDVGLTVVVTEGFGDIAMAERTFDILKWRDGSEAAVNGATQIRAGVMRPEIVIPAPEGLEVEEEANRTAGMLEIGRPVRIIRDPHFGVIGEVSDLPSEPHVLDSGSKARVLEVAFASGERFVIPRANVELIEG